MIPAPPRHFRIFSELRSTAAIVSSLRSAVLKVSFTAYSRPWFGTHRVLRGGSFSTPARLARPSFRNFYTPERADVFCGFRTCAA